MRYKALILDLDGTTVVNTKNAIPSPRVTETIIQAQNLIHISIATGRPIHLAKPIIDHLHIFSPCVVSGGVQIYDAEKQRVIQEYSINKDSISKIIHVAKRYKLEYRIYDGEKDIKETEFPTASKILALYFPVISPEIVSDVEKELNKIAGISVQKMPSWERGYLSLDMTAVNATKLHGINEILKILQLSKDEVIGVGDSYNDYPLLMASGFKIAMGNAVPELKTLADFIAPPVTEDGVATIIEKFVLNY